MTCVSWNNISNGRLYYLKGGGNLLNIMLFTVIYVDQPIGTGFSHGTVNVNSTFAAAPPFWSAFQALLETDDFKKFESRESVGTLLNL